MQNTRIDLPSRAGLQPISLRMIKDAIVALVPALQAAPDIVARRAGLKTHEGIRKIVVLEIVLRREIVSFRFGIAANAPRRFFALVHVMGNRPEIIEEFAQDVPAAALAHYVRAQEIVSNGFNR